MINQTIAAVALVNIYHEVQNFTLKVVNRIYFNSNL